MTYWSYALRYAAHVDQFLSSHDGLPAPYSFWHPDLPINPIFHAFGAPLIYRQQEPNLQRKLDPRGHRARYLGQAEQHGCVYVWDQDLASTPIRITNNVLRRTYREPLVVDIKAGVIIDPEMLNFDLVYKSDGTTGIEHVLAEYKPILCHLRNLNELARTKNSALSGLNSCMIKVSALSRPTPRSSVNFIGKRFARLTAPTHRLANQTQSPTQLPVRHQLRNRKRSSHQ